MIAIVDTASGEVEFILEDATGFDLTGKTAREATDADYLPAARINARRRLADSRAALIANPTPAAVCTVTIGGVSLVVQCDTESRGFISGAALAATISGLNNVPFLTDWTLADNTPTPLDGQAMINMGLQVAGYVAAVFERSRVLQARAEHPEATLAEIESLIWTMGD